MAIRSKLSVLLFAASISYPAVAFAQVANADADTDAEETVPDADTPQDGVQDIVVTAQRTSSSLQKTPVSIQAYSGDELAKRGVASIADLARTDSSVNINLSTGQPIIAIRGVSSQNATEVGDPAVSVAVDGIFTNRPYGTFAGLYDIERVEILRGPQGTLFGRNSTGGTINVITARATDANEARMTGEVGNYGLYAADGFGNFMVTNDLYARLSFSARTREGYRDNDPMVRDGDDEDMQSVRFQLTYEPSYSFSSWILAQFTTMGGAGNVSENLPFEYADGADAEPIHQVPDTIGNGKSWPLYARQARDLKQYEVRGGFSYTLPNEISINYLGGYNSIDYTRQQNINPYAFTEEPVPFIYRNREQPETINQELRLASDPNARLTWQAGAYFFQEKSSVSAFTQLFPDSDAATKTVEFDYPHIKSTSKALYAQATYAATDQLKLTGGVRYTWDKKSRDGNFILYPAATGLPFVITIPQPASTKSGEPTYTLGVDYQVTPDSMLYAKFSTGYKVGGFNDAVSDYGPEAVDSYEIGTKNTFFDRHLQLNLSAFRMDYSDQQVTQFIVGNAGSSTVNAGSSRIYGAEFNTVLQGTEFGRLSASANYTHARYREFLTSAGWDTSVNLDLSGNRLPLSPTWSLSSEYEFPLYLASDATITPRVAVKYQSKQYFAATNYADQMQEGYAFFDADLTYTSPSGKFTAQAYVKNLTNKTVFSDANEFYTFNNYTFSYQPPRTYGVRLSVSLD